MKSIFKMALGALAVSAATSTFAGQFPFPHNMKYPYGNIVEYADTKVITDHYNLWKQAWYDASQGWVYAPEGKCSTVSEAIAYGMLISVYMDDQEVFDNLYKTWTSSSAGEGTGMNWRIGCNGGTGSASDADFDAALALVMASKQWNNADYLKVAKTLISWIASNDIANNKIKPGNQWNDGFNASYATTANFQLFQDVAGGSWSNVISQAYTDLDACQDATTGLVPDWCDWNSHKPIWTSAAVSNDIGSYDDAARTPWRMAMAYYWYGDTKAQAFNKKLVNWLIPTTRTASGVNSGFKWVESNGSGSFVVDDSNERNFVSSTFSGGLGLATSSIDTKEAATYLGTVYKVLKEKKSCVSADGCGETVTGEKYYPATLNMLYLLLVTGNMPNFYNTTGFVPFTPDPTKAPSAGKISGEQQEHGDTTVTLSGLWNWGAYHDKLGIGTKMEPDSGSSPLFKKEDGSIYAEASMEIGPEPDWDEALAQAGLLKYPSAGIAVSFKKDDCVDMSRTDNPYKPCGVNFNTLGIKYIRVTAKTSGPIRMAVLNIFNHYNELHKDQIENAGAGAEPGLYVDNTEDYKAVTYDMTPLNFGFKGAGEGYEITILDWVKEENAPKGSDIITGVMGLKWEVKDAQGGIGEISIKSIEFLDANKKAVSPELLTGISVPSSNDESSSSTTDPESSSSGNNENPDVINAVENGALLAKISVSDMNISVDGAKVGAGVAVFSLQGKVIASGKAVFGNATVKVPTKGVYLVRVGDKISKVNVK